MGRAEDHFELGRERGSRKGAHKNNSPWVSSAASWEATHSPNMLERGTCDCTQWGEWLENKSWILMPGEEVDACRHWQSEAVVELERGNGMTRAGLGFRRLVCSFQCGLEIFFWGGV